MSKKVRLSMVFGFFVVLLGLSAGEAKVSACSNLGPGKHMGIVQIIDPIQGTFTIVDAETRRPVLFETAEALLKKVKIDDTIVVTYLKTEKNQFIAKDIVVHRVAGSFSKGPASLSF